MTRDEWAARLGEPLNPLRTLIAAYFNQDWEEEFSPAWQDVAAAFVNDEPAATVGAAIGEIDELLQSGLNEADLRWLLKALASGILPERIGVGNRQWLSDLRIELERTAS